MTGRKDSAMLYLKVTASYTAEKGPRWDTKILGLLKVSKLMSAAFLFRGAPGIIINKDKLLVTPGMDVSDDVSSEEKSTALIEYSLQPTNLKSEVCPVWMCLRKWVKFMQASTFCW